IPLNVVNLRRKSGNQFLFAGLSEGLIIRILKPLYPNFVFIENQIFRAIGGFSSFINRKFKFVFRVFFVQFFGKNYNRGKVAKNTCPYLNMFLPCKISALFYPNNIYPRQKKFFGKAVG